MSKDFENRNHRVSGDEDSQELDHEQTRTGEHQPASEAVQCRPVEVSVGDRGVERAVKHLKRKMAAEGILRELKRRRHYMKPSIKKRKKASEAARRRRKRVRQLEEKALQRPF